MGNKALVIIKGLMDGKYYRNKKTGDVICMDMNDYTAINCYNREIRQYGGWGNYSISVDEIVHEEWEEYVE